MVVEDFQTEYESTNAAAPLAEVAPSTASPEGQRPTYGDEMPIGTDGRQLTWNELSDDELAKRVWEFIGASIANVNINTVMVEQAADEFIISLLDDEIVAELYPNHPRAVEFKLRQAVSDMLEREEMAQQAAERREMQSLEAERRPLTAEERAILNKQVLTFFGVKKTAAELTDNIDSALDNWDDTHDQMVRNGDSKPEDKDRRKLEMLRLRKIMADTKLSEAEKQRQIEEAMRRGDISPQTVRYASEANAKVGQEAIRVQNVEKAELAMGDQNVSAFERANDLDADSAPVAKKPTGFGSSTPSGIETQVALTDTYNSSANAPVPAKDAAPTKPAPAVVKKIDDDLGLG